jgi:hypothetical protein
MANHTTKIETHEPKPLCNIKKKIITKRKEKPTSRKKAEKGNKLVILHKEDFNNKITMTQNNFTKLPHDITSKQHKNVTDINDCKNIIEPNKKWKYTNMNPHALHIHGTIKLHKQQHPIRPIVNWRDSSFYKLAKFIAEKIYNYQTHTTFKSL